MDLPDPGFTHLVGARRGERGGAPLQCGAGSMFRFLKMVHVTVTWVRTGTPAGVEAAVALLFEQLFICPGSNRVACLTCPHCQ